MDTNFLLVILLMMGYIALLAGIRFGFLTMRKFILSVTLMTIVGVGFKEYWLSRNLGIAFCFGVFYFIIWGLPAIVIGFAMKLVAWVHQNPRFSHPSRGNKGIYRPESYNYDVTTGNLASKAGVGYTYGDASHKHAVTALSNGNSYAYDANGNMTYRLVNGQAFNLGYDALALE